MAFYLLGIPAFAQTNPTVQREDPAPGVIHLHLQGEGRELGRAEGRALQSEIREMAQTLHRILARQIKNPGSLHAVSKNFESNIPKRFREELQGISDTSGVPYADLLLINVFDDLKHLQGCSSLVTLGDAGHPLLHGRNLDYAIPELARIKVIYDLETHGTRLRTFGFPGFIGVLTGMSSRGLALSSHTSQSYRKGPGEPSALLYRRMLEECASLEEMQACLARAQRTMGNNLAISDGRQHRAQALEFDAQALASRSPESGRLVVTNHFWTPSLQGHQESAWWRSGSGSTLRAEILGTRIPQGTGCEPNLVQQALAVEGPGPGWRTPANAGTVQSIVMEPATGRAWLACGTRPPVTRGKTLALPAIWNTMQSPESGR